MLVAPFYRLQQQKVLLVHRQSHRLLESPPLRLVVLLNLRLQVAAHDVIQLLLLLHPQVVIGLASHIVLSLLLLVHFLLVLERSKEELLLRPELALSPLQELVKLLYVHLAVQVLRQGFASLLLKVGKTSVPLDHVLFYCLELLGHLALFLVDVVEARRQ
jgi:hypothetical protein